MRRTQLALLSLGAAILAGVVTVTPAAAREYPWCAQGGEYDYPGECAYSTYEQCLASVSGRLLYCGPNPLFAYGQQVPPPRPPRRPRPVAPY
ncbi:DUF3551 domain-containing protein [Bradyrhizobium sp. PMVTL-01]|jgi:hypothetical protein|uniref:DUF3551 domain-containing protein n=1 Tax=unclassified Bradyrhizobium TaxID=2631580 RepID=UPI003F70F170